MRRALLSTMAGVLTSIACSGTKADADGAAAGGPPGSEVPSAAGASTPEAFGRRVLAAMRAKDVAAAEAMYAPASALFPHCPIAAAQVDAVIAEVKANTAAAMKAFEACARFDWSGAELGFEPGTLAKVKGCDERFERVDRTSFVIEAGGRRQHLEIERPIRIDGTFFLQGPVACWVEGEMPVLCARYIEGMRRCAEALPDGELKTDAQGRLDKTRTWGAFLDDRAELALLEERCQWGLDYARKNLAKGCPDVRWE